MLNELVKQLAHGNNQNTLANQPVGHNSQLMKDHPRPLRYKVLDDQLLADSLFLRMRRFLYGVTDRGADVAEEKLILREYGRLAPNRPYFYLKPMNRLGWLFERSGAGWVISAAEKIVGRDTFLRPYLPWDVVTLFVPEGGEGTTRITSERLNAELVSFPVYEQMLKENLELS